jgi:peptide/nickel transport system substrate-binding protein
MASVREVSRRIARMASWTAALVIVAFALLDGPVWAANKDTLVIGADISDTNFLDPTRQFVLSAPITIYATYEPLVTMTSGDYETLRPALATKWELVDDGNAWLFHLRDGVKFHSGNPLTADDVKFSFDRLKNIKDNPSELAENFKSTDVVDAHTVKITMVDKTQPLLNLLVSPTFVILDSKVVREHGGDSSADASTKDKASEWLNQNSAGTGPYILTQWERNSQIALKRNSNYWRKPAGFERVVIKHIPESTSQVLALKRGDIDAAINLTPTQLDSLKSEKDIRLLEGTSLDFVYMTLTGGSDLNKALAQKEAREAVAYAIDYDGIIKGLMKGYATRPPSFIPVGLGGVTAKLTQEIGYRHDPARAKQLLDKAGLSSGFSFELTYGNAAVAGTTYQLVAEKVQSDLAKVGITATLNPMDQANARTKYLKAETQSMLTFWNPDAPEPWAWAEATVHRVAKRVHWTVAQDVTDLVTKAGGAPSKKEADAYYLDYQKALVGEANYIILFQPIYRVATRTSISGWQVSAAGWQVNLYDVRPAE